MCWLLTGAVSAPAAAGARSAVTTVQWGKAEKVPGLAKLHKGGNAHVTSVSCWAVNDCAAGGYCADRRGHRQGFVGAERDGRWGDAVQGHLRRSSAPVVTAGPQDAGAALAYR